MTIARDTPQEVDALFTVLEATSGPNLVLLSEPDAGSRALIDRTKLFIARRGHGRIFTNLDVVTYLSLLRQVDIFAGNSSSGIMETPSFSLPTVNVGLRQQGRERARNVLDAEAHPSSILEAVMRARSPEFRQSLLGMANPYGEGFASQTIARVLTTIPLSQELLMKRNVSVPGRPAVLGQSPRP